MLVCCRYLFCNKCEEDTIMYNKIYKYYFEKKITFKKMKLSSRKGGIHAIHFIKYDCC